MALDPARYFVIIPNMLGNGLSSSPSNTPAAATTGPRFPRVDVHDNVRAQHRLITERFGIERLALVIGWSMGAGADLPVGGQLSGDGAADPAVLRLGEDHRHNIVFLEGVKAALTADAAWKDGWYDEQPRRGLRALARVYAGWGFSQPFYRDEDLRAAGLHVARGLPRRLLGGLLPRGRDANNLLTMLWTWQHADIGAPRVRGDSRRRWRRSRRERSSCPPRRTSTSRPRTTRGRSNTCRTPTARHPGRMGPLRRRRRQPRGHGFIDQGLKDLLRD